ncbi:polysaccharide deacetylase family protein [Lactiplantibacillus plantarum]|uniref:polysaccharide deacetylase family protein n=1 Tax=Lactiplantibacillus plantarum TaxID=1590 RepID=UPI001BDE38A7|nr:polysaccharide deacetylase family protein [Lactiplantibacillus plantarum]MCG0658936.1 Prophage P2a protein 59 [Lactiplantibacillus plantarum]MDG2544712.1 polysaccharide deacetylase family protein [Lactiplantibacillus plantarum]UOF03965.1 polysaccharide deacetylase family protein [Lactiplantibacillus plantarum subsp. plantarum]
MHMRGINFVLGLGVALGLLAGCQAASPATKQASSQSSKTSAKSVHSSAKHQAQARPYQHWHTVKDVHLPILMYHSISSGNQLRVPAKEFQTEMTYLKAHGYRTLTANEAVYALKHRRIPQKKIVWITLDDSYKDNMTAAWPILKQTHQHATINFITGFTHKKNHLTLADAKRMQASGNIDFQSHTVRHLDLNNLTYQVQLTELSSSKKWLDHNLQQNTQVICYPAGRANQQTIKADKQAGYQYALSTAPGIATSTQNPYNLTLGQRVVPGMSLTAFQTLLTSNN